MSRSAVYNAIGGIAHMIYVFIYLRPLDKGLNTTLSRSDYKNVEI